MIASAAFYDPHAARIGTRYASARFEDIHAGLVAHLPRPGAAVIDIGAGSGRDAYALAKRGYRVTAIEPSKGMRDFALAHPDAHGVDWCDDALPDLSRVIAKQPRFAFVLCSAVLMHLPTATLPASFMTLARLASPGGKVAVSIRAPISSDPAEIFYDHAPNVILAAARAAKLNLIDEGSSDDLLGRNLITWRWWVFQAADQT